MKKAYSLFEVKEVNEDRREITGWATTPKADRLQDIVDPEGAEFTLPIPLLWQHNSREPIGEVFEAKVSKKGIFVKAKVLDIPEPGKLKDRLDEAWQSIKHRLVRGLSIGFKPIEDSFIEATNGIHFLRWEWLELSPVTIPANIDASIQTIKAADLATIAASGEREKPPKPGVAGPQPTKGKAMKTIKEQITSWEATRQAKQAQMNELMEAANTKGETLDEEHAQQYDALEEEVKRIDLHLARLAKLDVENVEKAVPIKPEAGLDPEKAKASRSAGPIIVRPNVEKGIGMARFALAQYRARGDMNAALNIALANKRWMDQTPEVAAVLKAAVAAGDTTTAGWASELVYAQNLQAEFIEFLRPLTILGRIPGFRMVPFNMRVGSQTGGSTGYWVGQGLPVPMSKLTTSSATLGIAKMAGLLSIDDELARSSSPSAELLVRNDLGDQLAQFADTSLIDPTQGGQTNIQPPSLTYGVTPVTASGTNFAAIAADVKNVFAPLISANIDLAPAVWVMTATTALALSLMQTSLGNPQFPTLSVNGGTWLGLPVVVSQSALMTGSPDFGNMIVLIQPREVFLADDGQVNISISNEASIQMLDNPTNASTGGTVATTMVSMFQTNSLAIKGVRYINWAKRRTQAVQFIRSNAYA